MTIKGQKKHCNGNKYRKRAEAECLLSSKCPQDRATILRGFGNQSQPFYTSIKTFMNPTVPVGLKV